MQVLLSFLLITYYFTYLWYLENKRFCLYLRKTKGTPEEAEARKETQIKLGLHIGRKRRRERNVLPRRYMRRKGKTTHCTAEIY